MSKRISTPSNQRRGASIDNNSSPFSPKWKKTFVNSFESPSSTKTSDKFLEIDEFVDYAVNNFLIKDIRYLQQRLENEHLLSTNDNIEETKSILKNGNKKKNNFICAICLREVEDFTISTCGHVFCRHCIEQWLKSSNSCPKCHKDISADCIIVPKSSDPDVDDDEDSFSYKFSSFAKQGFLSPKHKLISFSVLFIIIFIMFLILI